MWPPELVAFEKVFHPGARSSFLKRGLYLTSECAMSSQGLPLGVQGADWIGPKACNSERDSAREEDTQTGGGRCLRSSRAG